MQLADAPLVALDVEGVCVTIRTPSQFRPGEHAPSPSRALHRNMFPAAIHQSAFNTLDISVLGLSVFTQVLWLLRRIAMM